MLLPLLALTLALVLLEQKLTVVEVIVPWRLLLATTTATITTTTTTATTTTTTTITGIVRPLSRRGPSNHPFGRCVRG